MQKAKQILQAMRKLGEKRIPLTRVYRCLYSEDLFLAAYDKIARNKGALTPGTENDTVDGMNLQRIRDIIEQLRYERFRFRPVRRTRIPKRSGGTRPLGIPIPRSHCTSIQWALGFGHDWAARAAQSVYHRLITLSSDVTSACAPVCPARRWCPVSA